MKQILIVEDEPRLLESMIKGLSRLDGVEAFGAASVNAAVEVLDSGIEPQLVISDLDLPGGRSGIELMAELDQRGINIPIIYVSAFLNYFATEIPQNEHITVVEKPVGLEDLRRLVSERLRSVSNTPPPFGVLDYVQLSCMGGHSVRIDTPDVSGQIVIWKGALWSASDTRGDGPDAFRRLAFGELRNVRCHTIRAEPETRMIEQPWEGLLLESARLEDEERRNAPVSSAEPQPETPAEPPSIPSHLLSELVDAANDAILDGEYEKARQTLVRAAEISSGHPTVTANLRRLAALMEKSNS